MPFFEQCRKRLYLQKVTILSVVWFIRLVNWKRVLFPGRFCNRGGHRVTLVSFCFNTAGRHKSPIVHKRRRVHKSCFYSVLHRKPHTHSHKKRDLSGREGAGRGGSIFSCVFSYMLTSQSSGPAGLGVAPPSSCVTTNHIFCTRPHSKPLQLRRYVVCVYVHAYRSGNTIHQTLWMGMERIRVCTQKWE